ncbi:hypothetical protein QD712_04445 [Streptomyces acidiscabies]|uniref:hypothetical protein n=1 Tax=Streptomyces acidiscabies TaxID=42234 RepID=UPI0030CF6A7D
MASAQGLATSQLQELIAWSEGGTSGRTGTLRAGPSARTTSDADPLSKAYRAGSTSSQSSKRGFIS